MNKRIISLLLVIFFFSCIEKSKKPDKWWEERTNTVVDKWIGQKITLPKNIEFINEPKTHNTAERLINGEDLKIVAYIDGNCSACLNSLLFWQNFSKKISSLEIDCSLILYVQTENKDYFKKDVIDRLKINVPCLFDKEADFISLNKLHDQRFQAVLLDIDDKVLLIGNPVLNKKLSDLYLSTLKRLGKDK